MTVVIPCYNHAHYLPECLGSLREQTFDDWHAIVIDDTSPDGEDILARVAEFDDPRVRVHRHERNKGLGGSRNTGFSLAETEFVVTLDADDKLTPTALEKLSKAALEDPDLDLVFGDYQLFGDDDELLQFPGPPAGTPVLRAEHTLPGAGSLMRRSFWQRQGGYDEAEILRKGREDFEFYVRASSSREGVRFRRIPETFYLYRLYRTSMSFACKLVDDEIAQYIYGKHRKAFDDHGETRRFLCRAYQNAAYAARDRGQRLRAVKNGLRAWLQIPSKRRFKDALAPLVRRGS